MELSPDLRLKLITGLPIFIEGIGNVYPQTVNEIAEFGETEYDKAINLIVGTIDELEFDENIELEFTYFEYLVIHCLTNEIRRKQIEDILSLVLKTTVTLIEENQVFYIGNPKEMHMVESTRVKLIDRENFDELAKAIRVQACVKKQERKKPKKPVSDKVRALQEKRKKGQELLKKARGTDFTLSDIVSTLGVFYKDISKIGTLTIYQLNDQYEKLMRKENYNQQFDIYLTGADSKQLDLKTHWSSRREAQKNDSPPTN